MTREQIAAIYKECDDALAVMNRTGASNLWSTRTTWERHRLTEAHRQACERFNRAARAKMSVSGED